MLQPPVPLHCCSVWPVHNNSQEERMISSTNLLKGQHLLDRLATGKMLRGEGYFSKTTMVLGKGAAGKFLLKLRGAFGILISLYIGLENLHLFIEVSSQFLK